MTGAILFTRIWGRALDANLRYGARIGGMALKTAERLVSSIATIGSQLTPEEDARPLVRNPPPSSLSLPPASMVLEGVAGSRASGLFVVENKLPHQISTPIAVGPLVDTDGHEIPSALRFEPGMITLSAGEQVVVRVGVQIGRALAAGIGYKADISVPGIPGARIPIVVRRKLAAKLGPLVVKKKVAGVNHAGKTKQRRHIQGSLRKPNP